VKDYLYRSTIPIAYAVGCFPVILRCSEWVCILNKYQKRKFPPQRRLPVLDRIEDVLFFSHMVEVRIATNEFVKDRGVFACSRRNTLWYPIRA